MTIPKPSLTEAMTFQYENATLRDRGVLTAEDLAVYALLERCPDRSRARRALHIGRYAARIARALGHLPTRDLWALGVLSVLEPAEPGAQLARYAALLAPYRAFERDEVRDARWDLHHDILLVAHTFETGIEQASSSGTSPADTVRQMARQRERFAPIVVAALRRALTRPCATLWTSPRKPSLPRAA